jgi:hypothetical protein
VCEPTSKDFGIAAAALGPFWKQESRTQIRKHGKDKKKKKKKKNLKCSKQVNP